MTNTKVIAEKLLQAEAVKLNVKSLIHGRVAGKALFIVTAAVFYLSRISGTISNLNFVILFLGNFLMPNLLPA